MQTHPLQQIPGVGRNMVGHLLALGYQQVQDLVGENPREMYERDCLRCGQRLDQCVLYVYRCAVWFAETGGPQPEKCNWWYWKDHPMEREGRI